MPKKLRNIGLVILILGSLFAAGMLLYKFPTPVQVPHEKQVAYQVDETQTQLLDHRENYQILTGHWAYSNFTLEAGKTLVVSWQTDTSVSVYVMSSSQYSSFRLLGISFDALARKTTTPSGSLSYQIPNAAKYYVVINPVLSDVNVASYKSELQWQESVTKYRTVTEYTTETVYVTSSQGINLGLTVLALGVVLTVLSFVNLTPLFKNANMVISKTKNYNTLTCDYCNTTYDKTKDRCPHCGARRKG
jgi:hypothetical protein